MNFHLENRKQIHKVDKPCEQRSDVRECRAFGIIIHFHIFGDLFHQWIRSAPEECNEEQKRQVHRESKKISEAALDTDAVGRDQLSTVESKKDSFPDAPR